MKDSHRKTVNERLPTQGFVHMSIIRAKMYLIRFGGLFLITHLFFHQVSAASAFDLDHIFRLSEQNDPQWAAVQLSIKAQQQISNQTRAGLLPSLAFSANTAKKSQSAASTDVDYNQNGYDAQLSQPLFRLDNWYQYQYGKAVSQQLGDQLRSERQSFIVRVVDSYFNVLRANESLAFAKAESSAVARQLEQTKQRFDVGLIAITDVHESQAAFDLTKVSLLIAESELAVAYENLETLTDSTITEILSLTDSFPVTTPTPNSVDHWLAKAQEQNPDLLAAEKALQAAVQNKRKTLATYAPDVDIAATYNHSENQFPGVVPDANTTILSLNLSWVPYQGGAIISSRKEAALKLKQAQAELSAQVRLTNQNIKNSFRLVNTNVLRVKARHQAITSSESALKATEAGYEVGTRNIVDVLQSQRSLFAAKRDYANARYDYVLNLFKLKQSAGELTRQDVEDINRWLKNT